VELLEELRTLDELLKRDEMLELEELVRRDELLELDEVRAALEVLQTIPPIFAGWLVQVVLLIQLFEFSQPQPVWVVTQLG
jgi:hypothetical protein